MADLARKLEEQPHFRELDPSPMEWTGALAILVTLSIGLFTSCFFMLLVYCMSPYCCGKDKEKLKLDDPASCDEFRESALTRPNTFTGLPLQQQAKRYYRAILPLALLQVVSLFLTCQILLPRGYLFTDAIVALIMHPFIPASDVVKGHRSAFEAMLVQLMFLATVVAAPLILAGPLPSIIKRLKKATLPAPKGTLNPDRCGLPARRPEQHVVIIPAYKEPVDVLTRTLESLAWQTYGADRITVVLAMEGADKQNLETFAHFDRKYKKTFAALIRTEHFLQPGELAGKAANENFAVRQLMEMWEGKVDLYSVMLTITDADSVFTPRYIEQLDYVYSTHPAPHMLMYHPFFDTRRNFFETNPIIARHEADRSLIYLLLTYKHGGLDKVAMSNYSITLGFARDIEFWTPDNMPEDAHTTLKAYVYTHGSNVLVPTYAVISNDLVTGMWDRYTQAKRHAWGVTEIGYVAALYPHIRFVTWAKLLAARIKGELTIVPPVLALLVPGFWEFLGLIQPLTFWFFIGLVVYNSVLTWVVQVYLEIVVWTVLLPPLAPLIEPPSFRNKCFLVFINLPLVSGILTIISVICFHICPRWHATLLSFVQTEIRYVTAPKGTLADRIKAAAASVRASVYQGVASVRASVRKRYSTYSTRANSTRANTPRGKGETPKEGWPKPSSHGSMDACLL